MFEIQMQSEKNKMQIWFAWGRDKYDDDACGCIVRLNRNFIRQWRRPAMREISNVPPSRIFTSYSSVWLQPAPIIMKCMYTCTSPRSSYNIIWFSFKVSCNAGHGIWVDGTWLKVDYILISFRQILRLATHWTVYIRDQTSTTRASRIWHMNFDASMQKCILVYFEHREKIDCQASCE